MIDRNKDVANGTSCQKSRAVMPFAMCMLRSAPFLGTKRDFAHNKVHFTQNRLEYNADVQVLWAVNLGMTDRHLSPDTKP
ncbi:hypothetical protein [Sphingobacterium sp.]|uniref:hypothetical protein n=1 Tax=Sphingobacterium sp. TaxID=341027 RepID=UPI0028AE3C9E|nr:hypothetical protein [Sphingobacterium sp.]